MAGTNDIVNALTSGTPLDWNTWFQQFSDQTQNSIMQEMSAIGQGGGMQGSGGNQPGSAVGGLNSLQPSSTGYDANVQSASGQLQTDMNQFFSDQANAAANANSSSATGTGGPLTGTDANGQPTAPNAAAVMAASIANGKNASTLGQYTGALSSLYSGDFGTNAPNTDQSLFNPLTPWSGLPNNTNAAMANAVSMPGFTQTRHGKDVTPLIDSSTLSPMAGPTGDTALGFYGYNPTTVAGAGAAAPTVLNQPKTSNIGFQHVPNPNGNGYLAISPIENMTRGGGANNGGPGSGGSGAGGGSEGGGRDGAE